MNNFKNLLVWQKSIDFTAEIYTLTSKLPIHERFALQTQMNRAVVSIPSNISEGAGRNSNKEYCHFLAIALGSSFELESQLIVCCKLHYFTEKDLFVVFGKLDEIQKMLFVLKRKKEMLHTKIYNPLFLLVLIYFWFWNLQTCK